MSPTQPHKTLSRAQLPALSLAISTLDELALTLPRQVLRAMRRLIARRWNRPDTGLTPMSDDWLRRYEAERARRRDIQ